MLTDFIVRLRRAFSAPLIVNDSPTAFILDRELSEVHLLIDFISSDALKSLPDAVPDHSARTSKGGKNWVEDICRISWPPHGTRAEKATQAALLVRVKDALNRLAYPASGSSIAFTLLVAQDADSKLDFDITERNIPSRISLARSAYPNLISKARHFRIGMSLMATFLIVWLVLTCVMSWYLAVGNSFLAQLTAAQAAQETLLKQIQVKTSSADDHSNATSAPCPPNQSNCGSPPAAVSAPVQPLYPCEGLQLTLAKPSGRYQLPPLQTASAFELCGPALEGEASINAIKTNLGNWVARAPLKLLRAPDPTAPPEGLGISPDAQVQPDSLTAYAISLANLLGAAVLPVFYGILGAGAAAVRRLSNRMKSSQLTPRDLILSVQFMALGAVVGACIGLFVDPSAAVGKGGVNLLGPIALSGSALSFIAGFGVEYVFAAMEALLRRIFATAKPSAIHTTPLSLAEK